MQSSADSENLCEKIYSRQGAASKMFIDTSAKSSFSPFDFSKIGKFTSLGKFFTQIHFYAFLQVYISTVLDHLGKHNAAQSEKLAWLDFELALVSRNNFDAAPCRG